MFLLSRLPGVGLLQQTRDRHACSQDVMANNVITG